MAELEVPTAQRVFPVFKSGLLKCKAGSSTGLGLQDQGYPFPEQVGR